MINIQHKEDCCGCNACVQQCPQHCISMVYDDEGFLYPKVDETLCTNCGACEKVCPWLNAAKVPVKTTPIEKLQTYAAKSRNEDERMRSSSGGMFILLANNILQKGGVVFGAVYDDEWQLHHVVAQTIEEVNPMMGSKYVQSRIENTYQEARQFLNEGRQVLFTGTACQIAGLKSFLRKDYDNLLAVDVICHGAPSPGVWSKYLDEVKKKSVHKDEPSIDSISFRDKWLNGWKRYCFVVRQKSASTTNKDSVLLSTIFNENPFMRGFLANMYLRPSCYACRVKSGACGSDITLGDFWGIDSVLPAMDDDKGTSIVVVHTSKGAHAFAALPSAIDKIVVPAADALKCNPSYFYSVAVPKCRRGFFHSFRHGVPVSDTVDKLLYVSKWKILVSMIKGYLNAFARRIICKK